jgi:cAMP-dependent protein kinase regulator
MFTQSLVSSLQNTIDSLAKRREEISSLSPKRDISEVSRMGSSRMDVDMQERMTNVERTLIHVMTRLDRLEEVVARKLEKSAAATNVEDLLASTERSMRDILLEMVKQQNIIERYRQENDALREKLQNRGKQDAALAPSTASSQHASSQFKVPLDTGGRSSTPPTSKERTPSPATQHTAPPKASVRRASTPKGPHSSKHQPVRGRSADGEDGADEGDGDPSGLRTALPVEYPPGYNPNRGRRFSVAGESFNPNTDLQSVPRTVIKKPDEVKRRIRSVITNNMLFKNLEEEQLEDLIDEMFEVRLRPDEVIIRQGDDGDNFYVVDSGELYVLYNDVVVATIGPGKSFGEIALMYNCPRTATVKAKSDCLLWGMSRATFRRSLMAHAIRKRELYESFLARVPLLETLLPYERSIIADALEPRTYRDGEYIIRQGEKGDSFYIIEKGKVVVTKGDPPLEVKSCGEGDYFGELALLTDQPRAANVRAVGTVKVLCLNRDDFANLMGPCEEILKRNMQLYKEVELSLAPKPQSQSPAPSRNVVAELVQDEANYREGLMALVRDFLVPMRKASEANSLPISPEDVAQLFSNIEMLLNIHNTLAGQLSSVSMSPAIVGKLFTQLTPGLKFYTTYCREWKNALAVYEKYKNMDSFQAFLKAPVRASHDLLTSLRSPLERVPKYLSLLKELQTASGDKDIAEAISKLSVLNDDLSRFK